MEAAAEMGELISKIDSIELSLHSLSNKGPYKPRVPHSGLEPLTVIHPSFKMIGDQAKDPPKIPVIIIQIDIRTAEEVRQINESWKR